MRSRIVEHGEAMQRSGRNLSIGTWILLLAVGSASSVLGAEEPAGRLARQELWVNTLRSEPIEFEDLLDELSAARVIYLGEYHSIPRHQKLQLAIFNGLAQRGLQLVLAMEAFEAFAQPSLDRFNSGEFDLAKLVAESDWAERWKGHTNYHALLAAARSAKAPVLALNARAETIRAVARAGLDEITAEQRAELPAEIVRDDPIYERLVKRLLSVHMAFDPQRLRPVFEAQVVRDEVMADRLAAFLASPAGAGRAAFVVCGRGHCEFGLGMPDRVARRMPGISQRIVLFSQSGDLQLSEAERKQAREVTVPHNFLREIGRLPADFTHILAPDLSR